MFLLFLCSNLDEVKIKEDVDLDDLLASIPTSKSVQSAKKDTNAVGFHYESNPFNDDDELYSDSNNMLSSSSLPKRRKLHFTDITQAPVETTQEQRDTHLGVSSNYQKKSNPHQKKTNGRQGLSQAKTFGIWGGILSRWRTCLIST